MEPSEALGTAAKVAVALAGFAGIVVVFRTEAVHRWSALDRFRLRLLLANSMIPLALCLFGILLLSLRPTPTAIWRWCSGLAILILLPFAFLTMRSARTVTPEEFHADRIARLIFYPLFLLGATVSLLQIYNAFFAGVFWEFFIAIIFQLFAAMLQFMRLILLLPPRE